MTGADLVNMHEDAETPIKNIKIQNKVNISLADSLLQTCAQYGSQVSNTHTSTTGAMRVREFVTSVLKTSSARGLFLRNPRLRRHLGASVLKVRMKQKTTLEGILKTR